MIYRAIVPQDIDEIRRLHEEFYSEWDFPDFTKLLCGYILADDDNKIILAGGVEAIGEAVLVTNKEQSLIKIGRALIEAQNISQYVCAKFNIREMIAFVNNDNYAVHLIKHGFSPRSKALSLKVENGQKQSSES